MFLGVAGDTWESPQPRSRTHTQVQEHVPIPPLKLLQEQVATPGQTKNLSWHHTGTTPTPGTMCWEEAKF